jgi:hypothetical protein
MEELYAGQLEYQTPEIPAGEEAKDKRRKD